MVRLGRFSVGVGDRFGREGAAQVSAAQAIKREYGVDLDLVWNKSKREHAIIGTEPADQRKAADEAVKKSGWEGAYFVDADHIGLSNVDPFLEYCDFFTIDVADFIGKPTDSDRIDSFVSKHSGLIGSHSLPGLNEPLEINDTLLRDTAAKYLGAVLEAAKVYRHIHDKKGNGTFIPEVSMDETNDPQSPAELLVILAALADEEVPIQTIAPKFSGRFNKGVEYVGSVDQFKKEFREDVAVLLYAVKNFGLPESLKLSVHSGSDKFAIYPAIAEVLRESGAGVHVKTAGTTWLEELVGLAEGGGNGLELAIEIYKKAYGKYDELCGPYASVLDVDPAKLPDPQTVASWDGETFASALRHVQAEPRYNPHFRQFMHVSYKIAAQMGDRYLDALEEHRASVDKNVKENLFERHFKRLFAGF